MARSMGRTDGHIISRGENSPTTPLVGWRIAAIRTRGTCAVVILHRLTNAFSKKIENLEHAEALHFMHYNLVRVHQMLKTTPAVMAGVADHVWTLEDVVGLIDRYSSN